MKQLEGAVLTFGALLLLGGLVTSATVIFLIAGVLGTTRIVIAGVIVITHLITAELEHLVGK